VSLPGSGLAVKGVMVIAATELKLVVRNRAAAALALLMPVAIGAYLAFKTPDLGAQGQAELWVWVVTLQVAALLGFTVYITTTISFAARRQDLYLKRLRSGEQSDLAIILGLAVPPLLLSVLQLAVILGMSGAGGLPTPRAWWFLAAAVAGGGLMCSAVGVLTSVWTRGAESAQITTAPFFFLLLMGTVLAMRAGPDASPLQLVLPGGCVAELIRLAWTSDGGVASAGTAACAILAGWVVLPLLLAVRTFRWSPRQ
jgi:ABC-2 type transport system permease protein